MSYHVEVVPLQGKTLGNWTEKQEYNPDPWPNRCSDTTRLDVVQQPIQREWIHKLGKGHHNKQPDCNEEFFLECEEQANKEMARFGSGEGV